jgi:hypothetical protein
MTFIDWSDREGMLGLLVEYVADERTQSRDAERTSFLDDLLRDLGPVVDRVETSSAVEIAGALRLIRDSQPRDFARDEVLVHLEACIEEMEA